MMKIAPELLEKHDSDAGGCTHGPVLLVEVRTLDVVDGVDVVDAEGVVVDVDVVVVVDVVDVVLVVVVAVQRA